MQHILKAKSLILLILVALCWGPTYLFIKIAIPTIPPLTLVFLRVFIGALILYSLCLVQKNHKFEWRKHWKHYAILGFSLNALPFFLVSYGELYVSSSLTGILNSPTLIFTAILAHYFGSHESFTKNKIIGISSGILGLCIIYLPIVFQQKVEVGIGGLMIIAACLSYASGTVYARAHLHKLTGITVLTAQLIFASALLLPFVLFFDRPFSLPLPPTEAIIGAIGLGVIGTATGFFLYYKSIQLAGATYASLSLLIVPIIAIILGALILQEKITWNLYLGTLFIIAGVLRINPAFKKI